MQPGVPCCKSRTCKYCMLVLISASSTNPTRSLPGQLLGCNVAKFLVVRGYLFALPCPVLPAPKQIILPVPPCPSLSHLSPSLPLLPLLLPFHPISLLPACPLHSSIPSFLFSSPLFSLLFSSGLISTSTPLPRVLSLSFTRRRRRSSSTRLFSTRVTSHHALELRPQRLHRLELASDLFSPVLCQPLLSSLLFSLSLFPFLFSLLFLLPLFYSHGGGGGGGGEEEEAYSYDALHTTIERVEVHEHVFHR